MTISLTKIIYIYLNIVYIYIKNIYIYVQLDLHMHLHFSHTYDIQSSLCKHVAYSKVWHPPGLWNWPCLWYLSCVEEVTCHVQAVLAASTSFHGLSLLVVFVWVWFHITTRFLAANFPGRCIFEDITSFVTGPDKPMNDEDGYSEPIRLPFFFTMCFFLWSFVWSFWCLFVRGVNLWQVPFKLGQPGLHSPLPNPRETVPTQSSQVWTDHSCLWWASLCGVLEDFWLPMSWSIFW